jgi:hypothetical protein
MAETDLGVLLNRILASFNDSTADYEFEPRTEALAAIIEQIPQEKLNIIGDQLIVAIKTAKNHLQLDMLKQSLVHVTEMMQDKQQVGALANQLFTAIKVSLDPGQIEAFGKGLEKLAPKISDTQSEELTKQLIILIKDSKNPYSCKTLGQSLASVAVRKQDEQQAGALANMREEQQAGTIAKQLFAAMKESNIPEQFDALGQGFAEIVTQIPPSELIPLINQLIDAIKNPSQFKIISGGLEYDFARFKTIGQSLAAIIKIMPEEQANTIVNTLFSAIKEKHLDPGQINALGQGLAEATAKMTQTQADTFAKKLISTIYNLKDDTYASRQFSAFVGGITGIAKQISEPEAYALANQFITLIRELEKKQNYIKFNALGEGLAELAAKVSKE